MPRTVLIAVWLATATACLLSLAGATARAQQFSAEIARRGPDGSTQTIGKLMVSNAKVRIETPDFPDGFFLVRNAAEPAYFVMPARQVFMDAKQTSQLTEFWLPIDIDDPCQRWQAMASIVGETNAQVFWRCERADRDTHGGDAPGGESVVKYRITSPLNRRYFGWISPRLRFLVRLEAEDGGTTELVNLQETAQPDRLFEIPPGFAKFDPKHLIERIKKSDAWVEPMK